jgi:hypothetical protein
MLGLGRQDARPTFSGAFRQGPGDSAARLPDSQKIFLDREAD